MRAPASAPTMSPYAAVSPSVIAAIKAQERRDIAEELEAAAATETQAARVTLYRQIARRLSGGR